ncbi:hypothetical protein QFC22_004065 [Naganishia vaughanmartiniae]|uniref:Uncharacterized protein n=1 Tax=Naganishia vaughanmartiniae TaxID=1424756 RepID=A0ACC2X3C9_9TREE|nr:hypothetical protein QFC22_004065 [Naganishia vaughanmartiniae]
MQLSHASINLPRLTKTLAARSKRLDEEDWAQVRSGQSTVDYARGLLKLVKEENVVEIGKVRALEKELDEIAKAFEDAVQRKPIPSTSSPRTLPPLPSIPFPTSLLAVSPSPSTTLPDQINNNPTTDILPSNTPAEDSQLRKIPIREASISLPTLTKRESFLAEKEEEALLPLRPIDQAAARDELLASADRSDGGGRGLRGAAQLHDELGGQLAEMSHQLKLNAVHFSKSLEDEKGILEASTEVISRNLDRTQASKKSLDLVRKKTGGTTWLTVISIIVVMIAFIWTYLLIRFT